MDSSRRFGAIDEEIFNLIKYDTFKPLNRKHYHRTLGTRWVSKERRNIDGTIRLKASLVVHGHSNFKETHSPKRKIILTTIRKLLVHALQMNRAIRTIDVKTKFFYDELNGDIYIDPLGGFLLPKQKCSSWRSLFGLEQDPNQWNAKLTELLKSLGFEWSEDDPSFFNNKPMKIFLVAHVDDILAIAPDQKIVTFSLVALRSRLNVTYGDYGIYSQNRSRYCNTSKELYRAIVGEI